jgi:hypothetical protein
LQRGGALNYGTPKCLVGVYSERTRRPTYLLVPRQSHLGVLGAKSRDGLRINNGFPPNISLAVSISVELNRLKTPLSLKDEKDFFDGTVPSPGNAFKWYVEVAGAVSDGRFIGFVKTRTADDNERSGSRR